MKERTARPADTAAQSVTSMKTPFPSAQPRVAKIVISGLICLSLLWTGCTSTRFQSAAQGANVAAEVRVGDRVECKLQDGSKQGFVVKTVEAGALVGESIRVPIADIASLEITRFDGKKTMVEAGKVVGGVVLISGLLALCLVAHGFPITSFR
jgi:hypothetical protein